MNAQEAKQLTAQSIPIVEARLTAEKEADRVAELRRQAAEQEAADNRFRTRMTTLADEIRYACTQGRAWVKPVVGAKDDIERVVAALVEQGFQAYVGEDGREEQDCDGDGNFGKAYYRSWPAYIINW